MQRQEYVKINGQWTTRYIECGKRTVSPKSRAIDPSGTRKSSAIKDGTTNG